MAFLSSADKDIAQPMELSLFASPTNQVAVEKVYFTEARPISSIGVSDTPIEIVVSGSGAEYIDLKRSRLYVKAKILNIYKCYYKSDGLINAKKRIPYRTNKVATGIYITSPFCFIGFCKKTSYLCLC